MNISKNLKLEEYLRILRSILEARVVVDRFGKIVSVNKYASKLYGYTEEELLDKPIEVLVPLPEELHKGYREKYMRKPHPRIISLSNPFSSKRKDGTTFTANIILTPVYLPDVYIIVAIQDTTKTNEMYNQTLEAWAKALHYKDKETGEHTNRVVRMTINFCKILGFDDGELVNIWRGAMLHDIGKMGIPDTILAKPAELTKEEFQLMQQHPVYAREMLEDINFLKNAIPIPYSHHEHWDGTGYPQGLYGGQIPLEARAFSLVDVYDALTNDRVYRDAWTKTKALEYIKEKSGILFDPILTNIFIEKIDEIIKK